MPRQRHGTPRPISGSWPSTAALLSGFIPRLAVRAALLWTETPEIMEISRPLDAEMETGIISKA